MPPRVTRVRLVEKMRFVAESASGHELALDAGPTDGGDDGASRPVEMVLAALGGCMGMDVISILRKMRQDVSSYEIQLEGDRAAEHPRVFTAIRMLHDVRGPSVAATNVARAIQLSMSRYCPVFAMLRASVDISVRFQLTLPDGTRESGDVHREDAAG